MCNPGAVPAKFLGLMASIRIHHHDREGREDWGDVRDSRDLNWCTYTWRNGLCVDLRVNSSLQKSEKSNNIAHPEFRAKCCLQEKGLPLDGMGRWNITN